MAATSQAQLFCFPAVHRSLNIQQRRSPPCLSFRTSKLSVAMSLERNEAETVDTETKNTLSYAADEPKLNVEEKQESYSKIEESGSEKLGLGEATQESVVDQQKKTAIIHDFCLGIPFGGFVLTGGIIGFLFSRSPAALASGVLVGGALLFLSTLSLKVWRQGKSSLPFILGQAALSGILIWKNFQSYSLAKKIFPTGISAIISSAMLCFYLYVLVSGGNPPPKKLKPSASVA
ncbi:protein FATTY ACID EXPORT 1, chloroplastic isoform X1 [Vicia villosa]|uniref:protein FATTY ACID EXPORT 1, chloroplastic isoform X1 n=2 Tax=Vicia villosa TaxID=3911 RepID=UPI00273B21E4|nr:protein FATTY ACID EXPORT 1, chloroplastic isoform X1 [Vicia villosa]